MKANKLLLSFLKDIDNLPDIDRGIVRIVVTKEVYDGLIKDIHNKLGITIMNGESFTLYNVNIVRSVPNEERTEKNRFKAEPMLPFMESK